MSYQHLFLHSRKIGKLYKLAVSSVCEKTGLAQHELDVLGFLYNNPEYDTAADVVKYRMIPKSNVSQAVDTLVNAGYLSASHDKIDRRRIHLHLTEKSVAVTHEIVEAQKIFIDWLLEGLSPECVEVLQIAEKQIMVNLEKRIKENCNND